jgi:uncharacterized glyoxalase superfamily protein PhnB
MSSLAKNTRATVIPCFRYRNAPAAIEWLCATFGFEKHLVVPNDDGTVAHAQLSFGNGMIMVGSKLVVIVKTSGCRPRTSLGWLHCESAARVYCRRPAAKAAARRRS